MPVITLSREYGAGGLTVGRRVADLLGADFLDSELTEEVARRLRMPEETVRRWDERKEGLILRLLRALQSAHPEYATGAPLAANPLAAVPESDRVHAAVEEVIREAGRSAFAVIVGRGAAFVLRGWPGMLHVRLVAGREARLRRVIERTGLEPDEAARRLETADRERREYLKHHYGVDWSDPLHYSMVLNTEALDCETAARIIVLAAGAGES